MDKKFESKIREYRKQKGWTRDQLGDKVGVAGSIISRYETGTVSPPIERAILIAFHLGARLGDVFPPPKNLQKKVS